MSQARLVPCTSCARHVRATEEACPFCGVPMHVELECSSTPVLTRAGLSRAALFALGAGAAVNLAGCIMNAAYGGPPPSDAGVDAGSVDADTDGSMNALYGGPPPDAEAD